MESVSPTATPGRRARISCFSCRQGKRRCDKTLPVCSLCARKQTTCTYPSKRGEKAAMSVGGTWSESEEPVTANSFSGASGPRSASQSRSQSQNSPSGPVPVPVPSVASWIRGTNPLAVASTTTAVSFLAPRVFRQANLEMPRPAVPVPAEVSAYVGDVEQVRDVARRFFDTTHNWIPFISKRRLVPSLLNPLSQRRCELTLLTLCMRLCATPPPPGKQHGTTINPLYRLAKHFFFEAECVGVMSIQVLQAAVLLAMYEIGQALYPAAYLTVGWCARYGVALGVDQLLHDLNGDSLGGTTGVDEGTQGRLSWLEVEEMRRTWWVVLIMDRLMNLNNPQRPLCTEDPRFDSFLPVDDRAFDEGTTKPEDAATLSRAFALKMGVFARLAQAIYLLGQALRFVPSPHRLRAEGRIATPEHDETAQLRRTLLSLVHLAEKEAKVRRLEFCSQSSICYCAILLLQEYCFPTSGAISSIDINHPSTDSLFPEARSALEALSIMAIDLRQRIINTPDILNNISVFLTQMVFQAGSTLIRLGGGDSDVTTRRNIDAQKKLLQELAVRWHEANVFLSILDAQEVMLASSLL